MELRPARGPAPRQSNFVDRPMWQIWYDDQCEICQAGLAWLRWLGAEGRVDAIPLSALDRSDSMPPAPVEDLLQNLHARGPDGDVRGGAAAVSALARLFPFTRWLGTLCELPLLSRAATAAYDWVARNRYSLSRCRGGACRAARTDLVRGQAPRPSFQICR